MSLQGVRPGFHCITPYLQVADAGRLIDFAKRAFGAELGDCHEVDGRVLHAELRLGDSVVELGQPARDHEVLGAALHYYVADVDAVYARAVAAGGEPVAPPVDHPYGERGASVKDPCGNFWYLATWKG